MARQTKAQQKKVRRVMHEFKHGKLETSHGQTVKNPRQAIAIGLSEAGASRTQSPQRNAERRRETEAQARREGGKASAGRSGTGNRQTKAELYARARQQDIPGRSRMSRDELEKALR